MDNSVFN